MMNDLSRREFLRQASTLSIGLTASLGSSLASSSGPHLTFPTDPRARLAVTSWPFREFIDSPTNPYRNRQKPGMDLKEFPTMVAGRFGVHHIGPLAAHLSSTEPGYLDAFRKAVDEAGSRLVDLGLGGASFWDLNKSKREDAIAFGRHGIDLALILGSPSIRQHLSGLKGAKPDPDLAAQTLGQLADYGATKNVLVNLENDNLRNEDPFFIVQVIEKVGNPYLRSLPDFGNTLSKGDPDYNQRGVAAMLKHAYGVCHVKDQLVTETGKTYEVDLPKLFALAKASGFKGYFMMEWDGRPGDDPYEGTKRLVAETLKFLG